MDRVTDASGSSDSELIAIVVTFERPEDLSTMVTRVASQKARISDLIIVDNSRLPNADYADRNLTVDGRGLRIFYVHAGKNLGPAGGMQLGLEAACEEAPKWEWAVLLDDNDPPLHDEAVAELLERARDARAANSAIRLVGALGSSLDRRTGLLTSSKGSLGPTHVDFIGGGYLPILHRTALKDSKGPFDPKLFWGMEELDAGLRIQERGGVIVAFDDFAKSAGYWDKYAAVRAAQAGAPMSRRYYSWRNALLICLHHRLYVAFVATLARVVLSGVLGLLGARGGVERARTAAAAIRDAVLGHSGLSRPL